MDCEIEKEIVNAFFEKRCRDRILFELKFEKKRQNFLIKLPIIAKDILIVI